MKTYLFTWNPISKKGKKWILRDMESSALESAKGKKVYGNPSCTANKKHMEKGNRAFLIHLGKEPKGIIAAGWIKSRWNQNKNDPNIQCIWQRLLSPYSNIPLPLAALRRAAKINWTPQQSGTEIPEKIAFNLEKLWSRHLAKLKAQANKAFDSSKYVDEELAALEGREQKRLIRHRHREQKLRKAKISQFRQLHKGRLFCEVKGCGFDFESQYGKLGRDYAQIHHLKPLANRTKPSNTPLRDLAVVCANCHTMVHLGGKCRPLDNLIP